MTPGQAAHRAWTEAGAGGTDDYLTWDEMSEWYRAVWETTANAAIDATGLPGQLLQAHAETRHYLARIEAVIRELEASAAATAPSKNSEIETRAAKRLRVITDGKPAAWRHPEWR